MEQDSLAKKTIFKLNSWSPGASFFYISNDKYINRGGKILGNNIQFSNKNSSVIHLDPHFFCQKKHFILFICYCYKFIKYLYKNFDENFIKL